MKENNPSIPVSPDPADSQHPTILIVEDNSTNAKITQIYVKRLGADTEIVTDGSQAVSACADRAFSLILMDLSMPVMNGLEATKRIRGTANPNRDTPVVALTANVSEEAREACFASGMSGYLTKPVRAAELISVVQAFLAEHRQTHSSNSDSVR